LSEAERVQVIGPTMNKLRSFTTRTPLRLMLGQSDGLDLTDVFANRKILLVNLSTAELGEEGSFLIGSLLVAAIWHATLARTTIPYEQRWPTWLYIDEFQTVVRLPVALPDMFSQARAMGLGITVAHQYIGQLDSKLQKAILGTTKTHVTFQLLYDDAKALAPRFKPMTPEDLSGLAAYEIAAKPCINNATASPVTGVTDPLPEVSIDGRGLAGYARTAHGTPRDQVEAAIADRIVPPASYRPIGEKSL
jgi:hypothetical protein